jgi:hypothetical protein
LSKKGLDVKTEKIQILRAALLGVLEALTQFRDFGYNIRNSDGVRAIY